MVRLELEREGVELLERAGVVGSFHAPRSRVLTVGRSRSGKMVEDVAFFVLLIATSR